MKQHKPKSCDTESRIALYGTVVEAELLFLILPAYNNAEPVATAATATLVHSVGKSRLKPPQESSRGKPIKAKASTDGWGQRKTSGLSFIGDGAAHLVHYAKQLIIKSCNVRYPVGWI